MTLSQSDSVKRIKVWTKAPRGKRGFLFELGELFLATPSQGTQFLFELPGVKYYSINLYSFAEWRISQVEIC